LVIVGAVLVLAVAAAFATTRVGVPVLVGFLALARDLGEQGESAGGGITTRPRPDSRRSAAVRPRERQQIHVITIGSRSRPMR
jgi:hypothetical protein